MIGSDKATTGDGLNGEKGKHGRNLALFLFRNRPDLLAEQFAVADLIQAALTEVPAADGDIGVAGSASDDK
eukprot:324976-Amphidinium_carterae.1